MFSVLTADEGEASAKEMEQEDAGVGTSGEQGTSEPELDEDIDSSEEEDDYDDDELPTFEFRFETAKLLIELDDKTHAATMACSLLLPFHVTTMFSFFGAPF